MDISSRVTRCWQAYWLGAALAVTSTASAQTSDEPPVPEQSMFTSVRQAFKEDFDHEVVRGHFDVGAAPDARRYYCLVEEKKGRREPNGVSGQPVVRADGMTGITANAVSVYSCTSAEQKGLLVTTGYVLKGKAADGAAAAVQAPAPKPAAPAAVAAVSAPVAASEPAPLRSEAAMGKDVAGMKLGMSLDEARAVLRSKKLRDWYENTGTLGHGDSRGGAPTAGARFVNVVAAWSPPPPDQATADWESFEIMFTPIPGKERVMAIIHSVGYSVNHVVEEGALKLGLVKKYGGITGVAQLPTAPTWTLQNGVAALTGETCGRRGVLGGLGQVFVPGAPRRNLSLATSLDDFQSQIDRCGPAILTEDHATGGSGMTSGEHAVTHFTVTAYSPSLGLEGAQTASQLLQAAGSATNASGAGREPATPAL